MFVSVEPFQPSLMFVGKDEVLAPADNQCPSGITISAVILDVVALR